jgi:hypothetical protein
VTPENNNKFPSHFSLSRILLYSPKCLKRIQKIIKNKISYLVPGFPSNDDIKLATELDIPLYCGQPQQCLLNSSKSGAKRTFTSCEIPTPPGAFEIYDEKEFFNTLSILIVNNLRVETWIFKIDDENQSRGIAYFNINSIAYLRKARKLAQSLNFQNY